MVHWLNRFLITLCCFVFSTSAFSQDDFERSSDKDYKDQDQFEKFYKRRKIVSAWQINKLKTGAIVVKLKADNLLIEALLKRGDKRLAEQKRLEAAIRNINLYKAFSDNYKFSKVYFIYSNFSDSLLNGARSNIFLDSNLIIDNRIIMSEDFYLISESDNLYNSSIGFLPEDSARSAVERGNPTMASLPIVLKNKYGHQLKKPFPYTCGPGILISYKNANRLLTINGIPIPYNIEGTNLGKNKTEYLYEGKALVLSIEGGYTYKWLSIAIDNLNRALESFYRESPLPPADKLEFVKPFLY
jgi:hypothetical protein